MSSFTASKYPVGGPCNGLPPESVIFGTSQAMQTVLRTFEKVAATSAPVLITGETGTGKELMAKQMHIRSYWPEGPFFKINCPVLRGPVNGEDPLGNAITGVSALSAPAAGEEQVGRRGTLFLNKIVLLDRALQIRLLETIQEASLFELDLPEGQSLRLRVVCSTSRRRDQEGVPETFLLELSSLIKVVTLCLPPLRERPGDVPELTSYLLDYYNRKFETRMPPPGPHVMDLMREYDWPGNIRQLENLVIRYVLQGSEEAFTEELARRNPALSLAETSSKETLPLREAARRAVKQFEGGIIRKALEANHWNRKQTAHALNISYKTLLHKIKIADLPTKRFTGGEWVPAALSRQWMPPGHEKRKARLA